VVIWGLGMRVEGCLDIRKLELVWIGLLESIGRMIIMSMKFGHRLILGMLGGLDWFSRLLVPKVLRLVQRGYIIVLRTAEQRNLFRMSSVGCARFYGMCMCMSSSRSRERGIRSVGWRLKV